MKLLFMGTPPSAAGVLSAILSAGKEVSAVVTSPDKPKGRGLKTASSPVAETACRHNIPLFKPSSVSDPELLKNIKDLDIDIAVVVAYGKILPKEFISVPKLGSINLHASLLPKYRGASPIQTALLNGDSKTGLTVIKINERLDAGNIIAQKEVEIHENDNSWTLSERLFKEGSVLLIKTLEEYENGNVRFSPQDESKATYAKSIKKEDGLIDFSLAAEQIKNKIRAFYQWPGAFCFYNGRMVKILKAQVIGEWAKSKEASEAGTVLELIKGEGFVLSTGKGELFIQEIQPENSRAMTADEFVRGYRLMVGGKLGKS